MELIKSILNKYSSEGLEDSKLNKIMEAYDFAVSKHNGKKRKSGEDFVEHPVNVAKILCDINVDDTTIVAALIHETISESDATLEEIEGKFGKDVAKLEKMYKNSYAAIPVLTKDGQYVGSVSEGDFLRHMLRVGSMDKLDMEKYRVKELVRLDFCPPLNIDASEADVIKSSLKQNFVPIVDSRNTLSGILTRRVVIEYLAEKNGIANS